MERLTVYVETSVVSYLTARPGRDVVVAGRQISTRGWWEWAQQEQQLVTSDEVLREAAHGDPEAARARLAVLAALPCLHVNDDVRTLAKIYCRSLALPDRAAADAVHLALASVHHLELLPYCQCPGPTRGFHRQPTVGLAGSLSGHPRDAVGRGARR